MAENNCRCQRKVVVTGLGVITPLNQGHFGIENLVDEFWQRLIKGENSIKAISDLNKDKAGNLIRKDLKKLYETIDQYASKIAAIIDFDVVDYMKNAGFDKKDEIKRTDLFVKYALIATHAAILDAKLTDVDKERVGVIYGSSVGGLSTTIKQGTNLSEKGPSRVSPLTVPQMMINAAAATIAIKYGFNGPSEGIVTACSSGTHAIDTAFLNIQAGRADMVITGGVDAAMIPLGLASFSAMGALSTRNHDPEHASRPYDKDRDGFVIGEGAGTLVLEEEEHAKRRGAKILAYLLGTYLTTDASHITAPEKTGAQIIRVMRSVIAGSGLTPKQIGYFNTHGTSTEYNDLTETKAIIDVFGDHAFEEPEKGGLLVSSTKSMTGHLLGGAGGIEAVIAVLALVNQIVPPTRNYTTPDPKLEDKQRKKHLNYVPNQAIYMKRLGIILEAAMSDSLGFGGHNGAVVFGRYTK